MAIQSDFWFSEKHKVRPARPYLGDGEIPKEFGRKVGIALANVAVRLGFDLSISPGSRFIEELYKVVFQNPAVRQSFSMTVTENYFGNRQDLTRICDSAPWFTILDICQACYLVLSVFAISQTSKLSIDGQERCRTEMAMWEKDVNDLLAEFGLAWVFKEGNINRFLPEPLATSLEEARWALRQDAQFKGPDEQFAKAIGHLNKRPEPDAQNAIKDAVGALEGVARIIAKDPKVELDEALKKEPFTPGLHRVLREGIGRIYGYKGDAPGVGHGQVGSEKPGLPEAEFVVGTCAAAILMLYKKFARRPEA